LFGNRPIDEEKFISKIETIGRFEIFKRSKNIIISSINEVKTDFVNYKYPLIDNIKIIEDIRFVSKKDIAAMKLNAIAGRGSKKDFIYLYFLLKEFSMRKVLDFYTQKYFDDSEFMVVKSLTYFTEAEEQPQPKMFKDFNWEACKKKIIEEVVKL